MMLRDLRKRGRKPWRCTIADGHLGLWVALGEQYPTLAEQRCWNHRIVNVLDTMPKKQQAEPAPYCVRCRMPRHRLRVRLSEQSSPLAIGN